MADARDIQYHYDVGDDFYRLFLDRDHMIYSCAVWEDGGDDTLEAAQARKLARIAGFAGVAPGHRVLDIGCGWGGAMVFCVDRLGAAAAVGLTLSAAQAAHVRSLGRSDVSAELRSWRDYRAPAPFYAVISIGAFEHFAAPEDREAGRQVAIYRDFFAACRRFSTATARLGLQTIVNLRLPDDWRSAGDVGYILARVFPGSILPTLNDIQAAAVDLYEIVELRTIGADYARTLAAWRENLRARRAEAEALRGAEAVRHYLRYFDSAERLFARGYVDLAQIALRPIGPEEAFKRVS